MACAWIAWVCLRAADRAHGFYLKAEAQALALKAERDRVTVAERDTEALRRELRKLSGVFYAFKTKTEDELDEELDGNSFAIESAIACPTGIAGSICDNWSIAQRDGPRSEAASCECSYCVGRRAERRALRAALVPKTVQGQAEVAKLNAGKP
ncbi:MAG TPA: hypothetical protein VFB75_14055 [Burkholderiales bacterium]|nr:hypothetical protein [Burkholderiales bacterium]